MSGAGVTAIVCGGRERQHVCSRPGCGRRAIYQCDYPVVRRGRAGTCDAWICERCRSPQGPGVDICPPHAKVPLPAPR